MEATLKLNKVEFERLLKVNNLNITSLSKKMNVDRSTIYRWYNGSDNFRGKSVATMLKAFGLKETEFDKLFYID